MKLLSQPISPLHRLFSILNSCVLITIVCPTSHGVTLDAQTTLGPVQGILVGDTTAFLGIPYAAPPIGDLRWKDPQRAAPWRPQIYQANKDAPGCPQECKDPSAGCPSSISEDCLYMNIFVPSNPRISGPLPVMVFLHGGNFQSGGSSAEIYDGRFLAAEADTIIIVPNYRLGALGFLYLTGHGEDIAGNFGLKDQALALEFIKQNAHNFGGNPDQITLAGQSSGAESAIIHILDPEVSPYFNQVVMLSNPFALPMKTPADANKLSKFFLKDVGCKLDSKVRGCLQSKTYKEIILAQLSSGEEKVNDKQIFQVFQPWGPTVKTQSIDRLKAEAFEPKPTILGSLSEDARLYVYGTFKSSISSVAYLLEMMIILPGNSGDVLDHYPVKGGIFSDQRESLSNLGTDYMFACSNLRAAKDLSTYYHEPVYHYILDQAISFEEGWERFKFCYGHVCHGGDLAYLFRSATLYSFNYTTAEQKMMDEMTAYFANFFHNGDPNLSYRIGGADQQIPLLEWGQVGEINGYWATMVFSADDGNRLVRDYKADICNFWDDIGYSGVPNIN